MNPNRDDTTDENNCHDSDATASSTENISDDNTTYSVTSDNNTITTEDDIIQQCEIKKQSTGNVYKSMF